MLRTVKRKVMNSGHGMRKPKQQIYRFTRGLWTAMPALFKVKETGQINQHFYVEKIF